MPGDSTKNQLARVYHILSDALGKKKEVRVDISKAFDRVWHKGLLFKLRKLGLYGGLLEWFESYLSNRKKRVILNNASSRIGFELSMPVFLRAQFLVPFILGLH